MGCSQTKPVEDPIITAGENEGANKKLVTAGENEAATKMQAIQRGNQARKVQPPLKPIEAAEIALFSNDPLLVQLHSAHNLPWMDMLSESDVFVLAEVVEGEDSPRTKKSETKAGSKLDQERATAQWPVRWDATDPLWESCRQFGDSPPKADSKLLLKFYDHDDSALDHENDFIGTAEVQVGALGSAPVEVPIVLGKKAAAKNGGKQASCIVSRVSTAGMPTRKTVYFVRHGESVWNKAQKDKNVGAMLSDVDHPLNEAGRAQAEELRAGVLAGGDAAATLASAQAVWCSPLTRAVQTCLIGLQPMLLPEGLPARAVALNPNLREKRNFGGKDSSGKWVGSAILKGVHEALGSLYSDAPTTAEALAEVPLELGQVQNKWWLGEKEGEKHVEERIAELLYQVRFCSAASIVLVGHSHYFREAFRRFCVDGCQLTDASGGALDAATLCSKKLSNAGIVKCELDFASQPSRPITSVQLLFATRLVD